MEVHIFSLCLLPIICMATVGSWVFIFTGFDDIVPLGIFQFLIFIFFLKYDTLNFFSLALVFALCVCVYMCLYVYVQATYIQFFSSNTYAYMYLCIYKYREIIYRQIQIIGRSTGMHIHSHTVSLYRLNEQRI